jgi:hypothetical protein
MTSFLVRKYIMGKAEIFNLWWLKRAVRHEPKLEGNGDRVLFHGFPMYLLAGSFFAVCVFLIFIESTVDTTTEGNQPIYFIVVFITFLILGIYTLLEALKTKVTINNNGILVEAIWPWYPKYILWQDVSKVVYSGFQDTFILIAKNGTKVHANGYLYGIHFLVKNLEQHFDPAIYKNANWMVKQIHKFQT